jgi:hypothetical protein
MFRELPFASYPEIRDTEVMQWTKSFPINSGSNRIANLLVEKVQSYAEGDLQHASEAFLALIDFSIGKNMEVRTQVVAPVVPVSSIRPLFTS